MTVTTGIAGTASSNTSVAGVNLTTLAATVAALSLNSTSTTASALAVEGTAGSAVTTGTAAVDTIRLGNGTTALGSEKTITLTTAAGTLTFTNKASDTALNLVAAAFAAYINYGVVPSSTTTGTFSVSGTVPTNVSASVSGNNLILTQTSSYAPSVTIMGGTTANASLVTNSTTGVAASAGVKAVDKVTFADLTLGQSVSVGGLTFTAGGAVGLNAVATAYRDYINSGTVPASTTGAFSGTSQAAMAAAYFTSGSAAEALANSGTTAPSSGILYIGGRAVGASTLTVTGGDAVANANAAVVSLTTQINTVSTAQSTFAAASTGLTAQKTAAIALQTGLTNTVDQIQNIDATAMQARLQQLNNQQSIDYYLVSQMNTEAAAILSIFR
jgi:hypothetical protein